MKESRDIHIACILNNPKNTYWALCSQGLQDQAHDAGIALTIRPVYTFAAAQSAFLDTLRQPHLDAIIVAGTDCSLPGDAAAAPRLPVIVCSGQLLGAQPACDLIPDLRRAAELAATYLVEQLQGQGKIVHIQGFSSEKFVTPRTQALAAVVAKQPGITVVWEAEGNFDRARAAQIMQEALAAHPDVRGVFAHSDGMALGALEVLEAAGRHDASVVGIDAVPEALSAVQTGRLRATVDAAPYALGRTALTYAVQIVQGSTPPARVLTDVRLITADNLVDTAMEMVRVFPNVLRDLVEGAEMQRQLQEEIIAAQRGLIQELSAPILPLSDSILVAPLIGTIDTQRAAQITESLLKAVSQQNTQALIIDITGVAVVDTGVVNHILQTARAARLLGTLVLLVGIGPEVAQTITQLGVDLSSIVTRGTLQAGLEYASTQLRRSGGGGHNGSTPRRG
jgi:ABC-type sugar transport system substrate-binding protein